MTIAEKWPEPRPVKLTIEDYVLLDHGGAFSPYPKTELLDGTIFVVNAAYSRHARMQRALYDALRAACARADRDLEVLFEVSVALPPDSLPQPDLVVTRDLPEDAPLDASKVLLVIEVAGATADYDLGEKARLYGSGGIGEYWVVDLVNGVLHQFWHAAEGGYREQRQQPLATVLTARTLPIEITPPAT